MNLDIKIYLYRNTKIIKSVNALKCLRNNKLYAYRMHGHYHQRLPNCITCNTDNIYRFETIVFLLLVIY